MSTKNKIVIHPSGAETATWTSGDFDAGDNRGVHLVLDVTAASGTTPTLDVKIQRKDPTSGKYVDLPGGAFAQKTGTGTDDLTIYPGIAETNNRSVSDVIGGIYRAVCTLGGTTPSFTFSLAGFVIP